MVKNPRTPGRPEGTLALGLVLGLALALALGQELGPGWGPAAGAAAQVGAARRLPQATTALLPRTLTPPRRPQHWMGSRPGRVTLPRLRWVAIERQRPPLETGTAQGAAFAKPWKRCWRALP